ncbi:hypothetical protein [Acrocarpospora catenulata]|uniref:hypothetical protein n=1 Tax=Acrocarpospora catenulata TaxID=2836182 RepID=UPI001BD9A09E|nr:hypothetical protein [Acrocarpospora catenulata]
MGILSEWTLAAMRRIVETHALQGGGAKSTWMDAIAHARGALAQFASGASERVAFTQNTSTGLAPVTNGLDWSASDNVVVPEGEFPSNSMRPSPSRSACEVLEGSSSKW